MKQFLLAAAALVAAPAFAQTAAPAPAPAEAPEVPRIIGEISAGTAQTVVYATRCQAFVLGLSAEEAQAAETAAEIQRVRDRYNSARDRFSAYQDCIVENATRDVGELSDSMNKQIETSLRARNAEIAAQAQATVAALQERGKKPFPPPPRQRRGQPAPAPEAPPEPAAAPAPEPETPRLLGSFSAGPVPSSQYASACPGVTLEWTPERATAITTREQFTEAADYVNGLSDRLNAANECVIENANEDLRGVAQKIEGDVRVKLTAEAENLNKELRAIQFYLNAKGPVTPARPAARQPARKK